MPEQNSRIELAPAVAKRWLSGKSVVSVELEPPMSGESIGFVTIRFESGITLYADDPVFYADTFTADDE